MKQEQVANKIQEPFHVIYPGIFVAASRPGYNVADCTGESFDESLEMDWALFFCHDLFRPIPGKIRIDCRLSWNRRRQRDRGWSRTGGGERATLGVLHIQSQHFRRSLRRSRYGRLD